MENELQPRHHPDIRWAIIISCLITACLVIGVAYGWNSMKKMEMEAAFYRTNADITAVHEKKINTMQEEVTNLRAVIENLKIEIDNYQIKLDTVNLASTTLDKITTVNTSTASTLPKT